MKRVDIYEKLNKRKEPKAVIHNFLFFSLSLCSIFGLKICSRKDYIIKSTFKNRKLTEGYKEITVDSKS